MAGGALTPIDWAAPWFAPWRGVGETVAQRLAAGAALPEALNASHAAVRFVDQDELPAGMAYEQFVFQNRCCPVRPGLHDFFNGLCWHAFPQAKSAMNALQAAEIARAGIGSRRGPVRDAITVFDENGALLHAPSALWEALLAREWRRLFVELRPLWAQARLVVFGHALLEKLVAPRKDLTAHVWCMDAPPGMEELDGWLAPQITGERLAAKPFTPLPVLGVPDWWPQNAAQSFYDDPLVFRPRRPATTTPTAAAAGVARP